MKELTRRYMVAGALGATVTLAFFRGGPGTSAQAAPARSVLDFRLPGDRDDSGAFARAIAAARQIHAPAGRGLGPGGAYLIGDVAPAADTEIFGDGIGRTVIRPAADRGAAIFCDSGGAQARVRGIVIRDLTFQGWARERGFSEHRHLVNLAGVEDARIERVAFRAFQGDGLILSSGRVPGTERHNRGVSVIDCVFDGVNNQNRNGISVIDGDRVRIERCAFRNCTRPNMPGAIDFEPDESAFAIIANVAVIGCRFDNIGGNVGVIGFHIPAVVARLPRGINIVDNVIGSYVGSGASIYLNVNRALPPDAPGMDINIEGNRGANGAWVYDFYSAKGIRARGNAWQDYRYGSKIGYAEPRHLVRDAAIGDRFVRCGRENKVGLYVFNVSGLDLGGSAFVDCGDGSANAYAISFARGASENVSLENVTVTSPTGRTRAAVVREAGHRFSPRGNRQGGNHFGALPAVEITRAP
ncbi:MAG: hypothetical protein QOD42_3694 [Sphingomonadales bacterium]|jgi:hypothetical protein|nr:hypothetical protein [Sphingomonadales bacterium]